MITAKQIADWAKTADAQRQLPRLVRRLIHSTAATTQITMPAGDSTSSPGLDGELYSEVGNAWVPKGHSCWEASCRADATTKANEDYDKRYGEFDAKYSETRTYVAVTGRKWTGKAKWAAAKCEEGRWADVRAYDADDLEQWLEQSPAVTIAFGEEIGLTGPGVASLGGYLASWSSQSDPKITSVALLTGRELHSARFIEKIRRTSDDQSDVAIPLKGDRVEEAVAFAAACLGQKPELATMAVIVNDVSGWRYVEKNPQIRVAVAASPAIAEAPTARAGLAVIVPYASGDMTRLFKGVAGRLDNPDTQLERPDHSEFEKALRELGMDENASRRLSAMCGRSWSVFRRQHAHNPAIRRPAWIDHPNASALATVCLLGTWSSSKDADKEVVSRLSGKTYDNLERELLELERLDDSPILHIGTVWKAKSALELMALFGDRITEQELDRFFAEAEVILSTPDPQLDLPDSERYAASIYGKTRPISGLLLEALCDTLIKLAVRGPDVEALAAKDIQLRVDKLVRKLLRGVDRTRWLSLADELPALAEASPNEFLAAVETSLADAEAPVRGLLSETSGAGAFGRCWHAGLLWALETLAWAPQRLTRVSLILARLSETKIEGNWGNSPNNSLVDLYRSWFPQTAATIEQRIAALDVLIARAPIPASALLDRLVHVGHDSASHTARPKWRDDDSGAGYGATDIERHHMLVAAADRQLHVAAGNADQVAALVKKLFSFDDNRRAKVIELLKSHYDSNDEVRVLLQNALRSKIHWHRNYDDTAQDELDALLAPLEEAYDKLTPSDPIIRHAWIFKRDWPELPVRTREEDHQHRQTMIVEFMREALGEIFAFQGWSGIVKLAEYTSAGWRIGLTLPQLSLSVDEMVDWIVHQAGDLHGGSELTSIAAGMMTAIARETAPDVVERLVKAGADAGRDLTWRVRLLVLAPENRSTWSLAKSLGDAAKEDYWKSCYANFWLEDQLEEREFALNQLLAVGRPVSALLSCHVKFNGIDVELITQMLEGILKGREVESQLPDSYHLQQAIKHIEESRKIERMRLAQLEFGLIRAFGFEGEHHAESLYKAIMSQPELFVELLCLAYKARNDERRELNEAEQAAAENAWHVLRACRRQPGTGDDGAVDSVAFKSYVHRARELAAEQNRLEVCDIQLGEIMARSPSGVDDTFPFEPARDVLDSLNSEEMLRGFSTGCFNKRGVTTRGPFDGGEQERELAGYYRSQAAALEISHPHVFDVLSRLASSYDRDGLLEELEVRLRRERH